MINHVAAQNRAFAQAFEANAGLVQQSRGCYSVAFFEAVKAGIPQETKDLWTETGRSIDDKVNGLIRWNLWQQA
jgi:hypothetical protein